MSVPSLERGLYTFVAIVRARLKSAMVTGLAVTIPLLVTVFVLGFVLDFVASTIRPVVEVLQQELGIARRESVGLLQALTVLTTFVTILLVGLVADFRSDGHIEEFFDSAMSRIPGIGAVYTSFNQMSEMLISNDTNSFQEVYLVEYPMEGSYSIAFVTADTPEFVLDATGNDEMVTLFMPMAPNPVMGGFVIHVSADQVYEVDMTVEEGIQSIVTSGVATTHEEAQSSSHVVAHANASTPIESGSRVE